MSDWRCHCGTNNFAKRTKCFSCDDFRSKSASYGSSEPGDWRCQHCNSPKLNFRTKNKCWTCGKLKSEPVVAVTSSSASSLASSSAPSPLSTSAASKEDGDWMCTACNSPVFNFKTKSQCFTCRAPRDASSSAAPSSSIVNGQALTSHGHQVLEVSNTDHVCSVCFDGAAEWCNPVCHHICVCERCKAKLTECPICMQKTPAGGFTRVFFP